MQVHGGIRWGEGLNSETMDNVYKYVGFAHISYYSHIACMSSGSSCPPGGIHVS